MRVAVLYDGRPHELLRLHYSNPWCHPIAPTSVIVQCLETGRVTAGPAELCVADCALAEWLLRPVPIR